MSGSYYALNAKYNNLLALIIANTPSPPLPPTADIVTTNTAQTISAVKTFSALPQSSVVPTLGDQLVNKTYADGLASTPTLSAVMTAGNSASTTLNMNTNAISNITTATATTFVGALTGNATSATSATTTTNIAGGLGGSIPYQSAVNTTALLANGTAGQVLQSNGTTLAPSWASVPLALINIIYPIGSIIQSSVSTNPSSYITGTTWIAYGEGQVLVGKAGSGTFATAGSTGGAETTTISANNLPVHQHATTSATFTGTPASHSHYLNAPSYGGFVTSDNAGGVFGADFTRSGIGQNNVANRWVAIAETLTPAGSVAVVVGNNTTTATAINNLQPYIVVYTWTRTA
jgi:hypothetical protein